MKKLFFRMIPAPFLHQAGVTWPGLGHSYNVVGEVSRMVLAGSFNSVSCVSSELVILVVFDNNIVTMKLEKAQVKYWLNLMLVWHGFYIVSRCQAFTKLILCDMYVLCISHIFEVKESRTFCAITTPFLNQWHSNFVHYISWLSLKNLIILQHA